MIRALVAAALVLAATTTARAGDPLRVYKTVESDHFIVHYYEPLGDVARRVAVVAERAHTTLSPALDHAPSDKTIIVVVDDTDGANGFAGVLPRNAITLYATGPSSFSELDDHDDWLYGLTAHEYTHVLHLDTMSGLPNIYNRIFGKTWAPNQVMPRWLIEGIAVYEESKRSAGGRNRGTRFDQFIRTARHEDRDLRIDEISGAPRQYPRGNAAYVYGSHFLRYVFDRFGDDSLRAMSHTAGGYAPPFALNRQIAKVVGSPFTELFRDWKAYLRDRYGMQEMGAERRGVRAGRKLTTTAEANLWAQYSADGREIVWLQYDGYSNPTVRAMPVGGDATSARDVVQIDALGPFTLETDGSIVFEQGRQYRRDYSFQDVFRWDARSRQITRLTTGKRARDPAVSRDGRRVAFSMNQRSESVLAVIDAVPEASPKILWKGARYDQAYQPAWSPDGTKIAFSAWRTDGYRDILVVDVGTGKAQDITRDRAVDMSPSWSADGRWIYFDSDRTGISNIYAFDTRELATYQVTNVVGGAFQPEPSPDGTRMVYAGAVPKGGFDLFEVPIEPGSWLPAHEMLDDKPPPVQIRDDEVTVTAPRSYRPLETLAPQTWTGTLETSGTPMATLQTGGSDAVGLHFYNLALSTNLETGRTNIGGSYGYTGLRFPLRLALSRTLVDRGGFRIDGVNKTFREEDWSGTFSSSVPFESRPGRSWTMSFDYDVDWFRQVSTPFTGYDPNMRVPTIPNTNYVQAGLGTRLAFSTTRTVTYGIGTQSGFDAAVALRFDHPALGAKYRNVTVSYSSSAAQRLWGETPVIAARIGGSFRAGDLVRTGSFALGGLPSQDIAQSIVDSTRVGVTGYLRGYPARAITGNQYHLLNLEYRQELFRIEHGIATLPVYFRRVHMALLSDTGTAFDVRFDAGRNLKTSVGAALRLDAFFGYFVPGTFEFGAARGVQTGGVTQTWFLLTGSL